MGPSKDRNLPPGHRGGGIETPGVISIHEIYRLDEAKRRMGWSDSALRAARRRGLKTLAAGKRRYLTGREILRFLEADNATEAG